MFIARKINGAFGPLGEIETCTEFRLALKGLFTEKIELARAENKVNFVHLLKFFLQFLKVASGDSSVCGDKMSDWLTTEEKLT